MPATIQNLETVFSSVVSGALTLAGIAVLVMLIVGGFGFLTAGGDKEGAAKAQKNSHLRHRWPGLGFICLDYLKLTGEFPWTEFLHVLHLPPPAPSARINW